MKTSMPRLLRIVLAVWLCAASLGAAAEARVFPLTTPDPQAVLKVVQTAYGDKVRAELIQQRLVVVGSAKQLDEVGALLTKIDRPPAPLHLTLREQPPPTTEQAGVVVYSSGDDGYTVDTVEGALVAFEYQQIVQQPTILQQGNTTQSPNAAQLSTSAQQASTNPTQPATSTQQTARLGNANGWLVQIDNKPQQISSLTVQVQLQNSRTAQILVSFSKEENQQRRIFGTTLSGDIGAWIPLLPQPLAQTGGSISSGAKRGQQLYLRIERRTRPE